MTVPLALDANLILSGEVTNITVGADNPQGVITPTGELFIETDVAPRTFEGTILLSGTLQVLKIGTGCFDTIYDSCVEGSPTEFTDCVGVCEVSPPPTPTEPPPECPECPPCEECPEPEECPECPECPVVTVSECDEVLHIAPNKILAWHVADCGLLIESQGEGDYAVRDLFPYTSQAEAEAGGWTVTDTLNPGGTIEYDVNYEIVGSGDPTCMLFRLNGLHTSGKMEFRQTFPLIAGAVYQARLWADAVQGSQHEYLKLTIQVESGGNRFVNKRGNEGPEDIFTAPITATGGGGVTIIIVKDQGFQAAPNNHQYYFTDLRIIGQAGFSAASWQDMSGNQNHLSWVTGGVPTENGELLNGRVTLRWNGVYMKWPENLLSGLTNLQAIIVVKSRAADSGLWRLGFDSAAPTLFPQSATGKILDNAGSSARLDYGVALADPLTGFRMYAVDAQPLTALAFIDGVLQNEQAHTFAVSLAPEFGRSDASTPGNFDVAEVILATDLVQEEFSGIFSTVGTRWGIL